MAKKVEFAGQQVKKQKNTKKSGNPPIKSANAYCRGQWEKARVHICTWLGCFILLILSAEQATWNDCSPVIVVSAWRGSQAKFSFAKCDDV